MEVLSFYSAKMVLVLPHLSKFGHTPIPYVSHEILHPLARYTFDLADYPLKAIYLRRNISQIEWLPGVWRRVYFELILRQ